MSEIVTIKMFTDRERNQLFRRLLIVGFIGLTAIIIPLVLLGIITHRGIYILLTMLTFFVIIAFLGLFCGCLVMAYFICKKVNMSPMEMEIISVLNFKKVIPINNISHLIIKNYNDIINKDIYGIYFVLRDNKSINISGYIHIDTLLKFLHKFMEYYGDKLTPKCRSSIKEFIEAHRRDSKC